MREYLLVNVHTNRTSDPMQNKERKRELQHPFLISFFAMFVLLLNILYDIPSKAFITFSLP